MGPTQTSATPPKWGQIRPSFSAAAAVVARRPQLEQELGAIEDRLATDLRVRSSTARLDQPDAITNALGHRPAPGPAARTWDAAAGRLAQHQAAFNIAYGIGPQPRWDRNNAYKHSHQALVAAIASTLPAPVRRIEIERPGIEL